MNWILKLRSLMLSAMVLFALTSCDWSEDAATGKTVQPEIQPSVEPAHPRVQSDLVGNSSPEEGFEICERYATQDFNSNKSRRTSIKNGELSDQIIDVVQLSPSDYKNDLPSQMDVVGGLEILLKVKNLTGVDVQYQYKLNEGKRDLQCFNLSHLVENVDLRLFQCFLLVPKREAAEAVSYGFAMLTLERFNPDRFQPPFVSIYTVEDLDPRCKLATASVKVRNSSHFEFPPLGVAVETYEVKNQKPK